jgi:hypothetical protein
MKNQTFGIEIEMNHITRRMAAQVIARTLPSGTLGDGASVRHIGGHTYDVWEVEGVDGRVWKVMRDGSIAGPEQEKTEVVSPVCKWEDIELVQEVVRALREAGAVAHSSCGIHVHIGLGEHTPKTLRNLVNIVNSREDLLTQALQISPERRDCWCLPVDQTFLRHLNTQRPRTSDDLARLWYRYSGKYGERPDADQNWQRYRREHYDPSRYRLLNLHSVFSKGTIEFRAFNSTLHAGEVKSYIQLCMAMSHMALKSASASPRRPETDNPAYTFRCWLLRLEMNGPEFKTAREHLMKHMPGNAAWRNGSATTRRVS